MASKIFPLRWSQGEVITKASNKIREGFKENKGCIFVGVEAPTGYGKTFVALSVYRHLSYAIRMKTGKKHLAYPVKKSHLISSQPVYVLTRTRSQVSAFLKAGASMGLTAAALPSKSFVCPNNILQDSPEDLERENEEARRALEKEESTDTTKRKKRKKVKLVNVDVTDPGFEPDAAVTGSCFQCIKNPRNFTKYKGLTQLCDGKSWRGDDAQTLLEQFKARKGRELRDLQIGLMDLEAACVEFSKQNPFVCPYAILHDLVSECDVVILTYPYLFNTTVNKAMKLKGILPEEMDYLIIDEAHNLSHMGDTVACNVNIKKFEGLRESIAKCNRLVLSDLHPPMAEAVAAAKLKGYSSLKNLQELFITSLANYPEMVNVMLSSNKEETRRINLRFIDALFSGDITKLWGLCVKAIDSTSSITKMQKYLAEWKKGGTARDRNSYELFVNSAELNRALSRLRDIIFRMYVTFPPENKEFQAEVERYVAAEQIELPEGVVLGSPNPTYEYKTYLELNSSFMSNRCLNYKDVCSKVFSSVKSCLLLSGTMPTKEYFNNMFGIDVFSVIAPDKVGSQQVMKVTGIDTLYSNRGEVTYNSYASLIVGAAKEYADKSVAAIFTSKAMMSAIMEKVYRLYARDLCITEEGLSVTEMVNTLKAMGSKSIAGIVCNSRMSEGVEFLNEEGGSLLDVAVICGIPIPPPSLYTDDQISYLVERHRLSEWEAREIVSSIPSWMSVRQAAGRLNRGPSDESIVFYADSRYSSQKFWKKMIPCDGVLSWEGKMWDA